MTAQSTSSYHFGDLLALARQSWVQQLTGALTAAGFPDYRRSDALAVRLLRRGSLSIGLLGDALGVTRQAARKVAATLEGRGYAIVERDAHDARQFNVSLTPHGRDYGAAIASAIDVLDDGLVERLTPAQLAAADTVLRTVLADGRSHVLAAHILPPGAARDDRR